MKTFFLALFILMMGCQLKPTKVYQAVPTQTSVSSEPGALDPETVIIDARPAFEYAVAHLSGALSMQWDEFTQRKKGFRGVFETDLYAHTRRLARYGISPTTPVLVVGRGLAGQGEEGRVAWTLRYLGVRNVKFAPADSFKLPLTQAEAPPRKEKTPWAPEFDSTLAISIEDFKKLQSQDFIAIDVREPLAIKQKPLPFKANHIFWQKFFDEKMQPRAEELPPLGVAKDYPVVVISDLGVESAAVTLALREMGFSSAKNLIGGAEALRIGIK